MEQLDPGRAAQLLEQLSADQRTEIVREMGQVERRRILPKLSAESRAELEGLLQYPPHTAGGIMTTEFVRLSPEHDRRRRAQAPAVGGSREGVDLRLLRDGARRRAGCWAPCRCGTW